jgi:hypothetical protein
MKGVFTDPFLRSLNRANVPLKAPLVEISAHSTIALAQPVWSMLRPGMKGACTF